MTLSNCSQCRYFDHHPNHSRDIVCGVCPAYASMWQRLKTLDTHAHKSIPIDNCRDFALNPLLEEKEINLSLGFYEWEQLARINSIADIAERLKNCQIDLSLTMSRQHWQNIADSSTSPQVLEQLQAHGFEPTHSDVFEWIEVDSDYINAIAYDALYSTLSIRFNSGDVYEYEGVHANEFLQFRDAHSKGRFFDYYIKDHYSYVIAS